jgi:hypothetical protein
MKKPILVFLTLLLLILNIHGQFINNRIDVFGGYRFNTTFNDDAIEVDKYLPHQPQPNMANTIGYSLKGLYYYGRILYSGINFQYNLIENWRLVGSRTIEIKFYTNNLNFIIGIRSPAKEQGFFNRFGLGLELAPFLGELHYSNDTVTRNGYNKSLKASYVITGIESSLGISMNITNFFGFSTRFGYNFNQLSTDYFFEKNHSYVFLECGLYIRMMKNKRFYN